MTREVEKCEQKCSPGTGAGKQQSRRLRPSVCVRVYDEGGKEKTVKLESSYSHMQHVTDSPNNNNNLYRFFFGFLMQRLDSNQICLCLLRVFPRSRIDYYRSAAEVERRQWGTFYVRTNKSRQEEENSIDERIPMPFSVATHAENYRIKKGRARFSSKDLCHLKSTIYRQFYKKKKTRQSIVRAHVCDCCFNIKCFVGLCDNWGKYIARLVLDLCNITSINAIDSLSVNCKNSADAFINVAKKKRT